MPWSVSMCYNCNKMCSYFRTGNAMNVQLANTSRQAYTTTAQDTFTYVGWAQLCTVTIYPTAEPAILSCAWTKYLAYQNDETFLYNVASINT